MDWINKFNGSSKKFTVNTWKDTRKQNRITQMLPEVMFIDVLMDMICWDETDGSWDVGEPINYDELYNVPPWEDGDE